MSRQRSRRPATVRPAEYDGSPCGAEYEGPNLEAWADAGYGIGTCRRRPGHQGDHVAGVAWGDRDHPDETAGEVRWG